MTADTNSAGIDWYTGLPGIHRVWDATTLSELRTCARRYELLRVKGYYPLSANDVPTENVHTRFGHELHAMIGDYDRAIWEGASADEAGSRALLGIVERAWQWGGYVFDMWRCTGVEYRGATQRRSFLCDGARDWWVGKQEVCSRCERPVERRRSYVPDHSTKNVLSLVRAVAAYGEYLETSQWHNAVFEEKLAIGVKLKAQLPAMPAFWVAGELDGISLLRRGTDLFVREIKSTSRTPNTEYWAPFATRLQLLLYVWLARQNHIPVRGAYVQAFHVSAKGVEISERVFSFPSSLLQEAIEEVQDDIKALQKRASAEQWPRNIAVCAVADGGQACQFLRACAAPPEDREEILAFHYGQGPLWNPATASHEPVEETTQ